MATGQRDMLLDRQISRQIDSWKVRYADYRDKTKSNRHTNRQKESQTDRLLKGRKADRQTTKRKSKRQTTKRKKGRQIDY